MTQIFGHENGGILIVVQIKCVGNVIFLIRAEYDSLVCQGISVKKDVKRSTTQDIERSRGKKRKAKFKN